MSSFERSQPDSGAVMARPVLALPAALQRSFALIAFDWDGTAVTDRRADATEVRLRLEHLLHQGVWIAVISGTSFENIDGQLTTFIHGPHQQRLILCTNRGSEVFGFDPAGRPVLRRRRVATTEEERKLTETADRARDELVTRTGLPISVIYDRLNRRKIDLIPLPEWRDPPKEAIGKLLRAVQTRLRQAGLIGGLSEALLLTERTAREYGPAGARITSDVKHIEVGLTDKGDAIAWLMREIARPQGISRRDMLIMGDEFGTIAGYPGSDSRMLIPEARGAVVVSVGREPAGVPAGVIALGGGPAAFLAILDDQGERHRALEKLR